MVRAFCWNPQNPVTSTDIFEIKYNQMPRYTGGDFSHGACVIFEPHRPLPRQSYAAALLFMPIFQVWQGVVYLGTYAPVLCCRLIVFSRLAETDNLCARTLLAHLECESQAKGNWFHETAVRRTHAGHSYRILRPDPPKRADGIPASVQPHPTTATSVRQSHAFTGPLRGNLL